MLNVSGSDAGIHEKSIVCVDGKESRGSKRKDCGEGAVRSYQTLNVYSDDYGMCVAQKFIEEKTNEIPAAQEILGIMDLKNIIVTTDAINCQKETASAVIRSGGDYVLALKRNQHLFYSEVSGYFDRVRLKELEVTAGSYKKTMEKEHGGTATREYYIMENINWYSGKKEWKNQKSFGMVHKTVKNNDDSGYEECRYYIVSIASDAEEFERAVRRHWGVENHIHWQLDFTFGDDKNTNMAETGGKNLQTKKKIALSILRLVKDSYKLSMKRIRYELALDYEKGIEIMLSLLDVESIEKALKSKGKSSQK